MEEIKKTCKIHGILRIKKISISRRSYILKTTGQRTLKYQLQCLLCRKDYDKKYLVKNKDRCLSIKKNGKKKIQIN